MSDLGELWDHYFKVAKQSGFNDEQSVAYADRQIKILEGKDDE